MRVWHDPWVVSGPLFVPRPRDPSLLRDDLLTVRDLLIPNSCIWNESLIRQLFVSEDA